MRVQWSFLPLLFVLTPFLFGCGQQTSQVNASIQQAAGVTLRGTVYQFQLSNFNIGNAIPNAIVKIEGDSGSCTTVANAKGEYVFSNLPDGSYRLSATAEGYAVYMAFNGQPSIKPVQLRAAANTITTLDLLVFIEPTVTGFSPAAGSIITNDQVFTMRFDKAMDTSSVRIDLAPQGLRTSSAGDGNTVQVTLSWSQDSKEVTVTPIGSLASNETYRLELGIPSFSLIFNNAAPPYDSKGNPFYLGIWFGSPVFDNSQLPYADYRTPTGGLPTAPANLQVAINNHPTAEVDFSDVITGANLVQLNWTAATGNLTGYRIYVAKSGSNYALLQDTSGNSSTGNCSFISDVNSVIAALYQGTVDPVATGNYPFINDTISFKVVAYNGDGESGGPTVSARDAVGPQFSAGYAKAGYLGSVASNNYYFSPIPLTNLNRIYVAFDEPISAATITNANFSLDGGLNITAATFMTNLSTPTGTYAVMIDADGSLNGRTLTVKPGVTDLSGNPVKAGTGDTLGPFVIP